MTPRERLCGVAFETDARASRARCGSCGPTGRAADAVDRRIFGEPL